MKSFFGLTLGILSAKASTLLRGGITWYNPTDDETAWFDGSVYEIIPPPKKSTILAFTTLEGETMAPFEPYTSAVQSTATFGATTTANPTTQASATAVSGSSGSLASVPYAPSTTPVVPTTIPLFSTIEVETTSVDTNLSSHFEVETVQKDSTTSLELIEAPEPPAINETKGSGIFYPVVSMEGLL